MARRSNSIRRRVIADPWAFQHGEPVTIRLETAGRYLVKAPAGLETGVREGCQITKGHARTNSRERLSVLLSQGFSLVSDDGDEAAGNGNRSDSGEIGGRDDL